MILINRQLVVLIGLILACGCARRPPDSIQDAATVKPEIETFEDLIRLRLPTAQLLSVTDRGRPPVDALGTPKPRIELTFAWTFQSETFSITSESKPLPEVLVRMIFERGSPISFIYDAAQPVNRIEGKWELRGKNELLLVDVKTDYGVMPYVKLEVYHPSPNSLYISGAGDAEVRFQVDGQIGN